MLRIQAKNVSAQKPFTHDFGRIIGDAMLLMQQKDTKNAIHSDNITLFNLP